MSNRTLTYRGLLAVDTEQRLLLSTKKGEMGYRIKDFQIMVSTPGNGNVELIGQIFKKSQTPSTTVDFSNNRLLAVALFHDGAANDTTHFMSTTIFDNEIFNQDIFVNITDATGSSLPGNYYIELEVIKLDESQAMVATLKDIRNNS